MKVTLLEKKLAAVEADVIVNNTTQGLEISPNLQEAAGPGLRDECLRRYPNGIGYGEVAITRGHGLMCAEVFHIALPSYLHLNSLQVVFRTLTKCLNVANRRKWTSIAFASQGRGLRTYPPDVIADTFSNCVACFKAERRPRTTLKEVFIVAGNDVDGGGVQKYLARSGTVVTWPGLGMQRSKTKLPKGHSKFCGLQYDCEHSCAGFKGESSCPPCLHPECREEGQQTRDDPCAICLSDPLSASPVIQMKCGHIFHLKCTRTLLKKKWVGPKINFNFLRCPLCQSRMLHRALDDLLTPVMKIEEYMQKHAMMRLRREGLHLSKHVLSTESPFYHNPIGFAMKRYAFSECFKCKKPYFLGAEGEACTFDPVNNPSPEELLCPHCTLDKYQRERQLCRSEDTIKRTTRKCPHCQVSIERSGVCMHMYCTRCKRSFHWSDGIAHDRRPLELTPGPRQLSFLSTTSREMDLRVHRQHTLLGHQKPNRPHGLAKSFTNL